MKKQPKWWLVVGLVGVLVVLLVAGIFMGQTLGSRLITPNITNQLPVPVPEAPISITNQVLLDKLVSEAARGVTGAPKRVIWQVETGMVPGGEAVAAFLPDLQNRGGRLVGCLQPVESAGGEVVTMKIQVDERAKEASLRGDVTQEKVSNLIISCAIRAVSNNREVEFLEAKISALQDIIGSDDAQPGIINL